jgi:membrane protease subunit HflC
MKKPFAIVAGILVAVLAILAASSLFTVHQAEQALVLQFGEPRRVIQKPGLNFKIPFVQNVRYLDFRLLEFDAPAEEMILSDQKRLVVDAFTLYRISNPLKFYQSVGTEAVARTRLGSIVNAATRRTLGSVPLSTVVSKERASIMSDIRDTVNKEAKPLGIDVVDVRMKRADLPDENSQAIFRRMQTEREREAKEFRAQGAEVGQRIRSRADKEKTILLAEARKNAQILRGQGDGEAVRIFAEAFGQDVDFFSFYRSMQAYREALSSDDTTMVLSPESDFFKFFDHIEGVQR